MIKELDYLDRILYFQIQGIYLFWWIILLLIIYFFLDMIIAIIKKIMEKK